MTLDLLYQLSTFPFLIPWVLLFFFPRWKYTQFVVQGLFVPILLGVVYTWLIFSNEQPGNPDFLHLEGAKILFESPKGFLSGWIHYVIFDLFVAAWIVRDSVKHNIKHLVILPSLLITLVLGPIGLLTYSIIRIVKTKSILFD